MRDAYDEVLAQNPMFERKSELAPGYIEYAARFADENRASAMTALGRALRVDDDEARRKRTESLLNTLQAEELAERGILDQTLLLRAIELDPENARARRVLESARRGEQQKQSELGRYAAASAILIASLLAIGFIVFFRGGERKGSQARRAAESEQRTSPPPEQDIAS
jgi:hypothetical protein